jgi:hypothetical protein
MGMVTEAAVTLDSHRARLTKDNRALSAEILSPPSARFDLVATPGSDATRKLVVRLPSKVERAEITVSLTPKK